jgi:hypothetical protein
VLVFSSISSTRDLVGPGFRVVELQKSEEKLGEELGMPMWEELGTNVKNKQNYKVSSLPPMFFS